MVIGTDQWLSGIDLKKLTAEEDMTTFLAIEIFCVLVCGS